MNFRYIREPVLVDAFQLTGEQWAKVGQKGADFTDWPDWLRVGLSKAPTELGYIGSGVHGTQTIVRLRTSYGIMFVQPNEWITYDSLGHWWVCAPDQFDLRYTALTSVFKKAGFSFALEEASVESLAPVEPLSGLSVLSDETRGKLGCIDGGLVVIVHEVPPERKREISPLLGYLFGREEIHDEGWALLRGLPHWARRGQNLSSLHTLLSLHAPPFSADRGILIVSTNKVEGNPHPNLYTYAELEKALPRVTPWVLRADQDS